MYEDLRTQTKESLRDHANDMLEVQTVYEGKPQEKQRGEEVMKRISTVVETIIVALVLLYFLFSLPNLILRWMG